MRDKHVRLRREPAWVDIPLHWPAPLQCCGVSYMRSLTHGRLLFSIVACMRQVAVSSVKNILSFIFWYCYCSTSKCGDRLCEGTAGLLYRYTERAPYVRLLSFSVVRPSSAASCVSVGVVLKPSSPVPVPVQPVTSYEGMLPAPRAASFAPNGVQVRV